MRFFWERRRRDRELDEEIRSHLEMAVRARLAACWIPARRATRVDPISALRYE